MFPFAAGYSKVVSPAVYGGIAAPSVYGANLGMFNVEFIFTH